MPILLPRVRKFTSTWRTPERAQEGASAAEAGAVTGLPKRRRFVRSESDDLRLRPSAAPSGSAGDRGGPGGTSLVGVRATTCRASSLPRVSVARLCVPVGAWQQQQQRLQQQ